METHEDGGPHNGQTPKEPTGTWVEAKVIKEGENEHRKQRQTQSSGDGSRNKQRRLAGGGWRAADVGDDQVDYSTLRERRWGAGVKIGGTTKKGC